MSPEAARADEKVDRQSRILEAVLRLLSRHGISGVSMRSVAREADVALGLVSYYYEDKVSLIRAALHRIEEHQRAYRAPALPRDVECEVTVPFDCSERQQAVPLAAFVLTIRRNAITLSELRSFV
jgi:AcrR family transcriptional regulator